MKRVLAFLVFVVCFCPIWAQGDETLDLFGVGLKTVETLKCPPKGICPNLVVLKPVRVYLMVNYDVTAEATEDVTTAVSDWVTALQSVPGSPRLEWTEGINVVHISNRISR